MTTFERIISSSQTGQDVTYTTKNNKNSPLDSSEALMCTKLFLDTLSVSCNKMIASQIAVADVFLSPGCLLLLLLS